MMASRQEKMEDSWSAVRYSTTMKEVEGEREFINPGHSNLSSAPKP